jgi:ubiquinone/menaquinone biosynthesis C-methylase UbiE
MHPHDPERSMGTTSYVLGHAADELDRLDAQSAFLRPATAALLASCGLAPGMRVLDVGCGTGEVTLMCADAVGPGGAVLGVDRAPEALEKARERAELRGATHARFHEGDLAALTAAERYDAVVGRMVLMHQPDPAATLAGLAALARPGGAVAFGEIVVLPATPAAPERPLMAQVCDWIARTLEGAGAWPRMGLGLHDAFVRAGLPAPEVRLEPLLTLGCERAYARWGVQTLRTLLPVGDQLGVFACAEVDIATLAERLDEEAAAAGGVAMPCMLGTAWARRPG